MWRSRSARTLGSLKKALDYLPLPKNDYYYDKNVVTILLSLGKIASKFTVVMDTAIGNAIYVYSEDGKYLRFSKTKNKLYCCELKADKEEREDCFFWHSKRENGNALKIGLQARSGRGKGALRKNNIPFERNADGDNRIQCTRNMSI